MPENNSNSLYYAHEYLEAKYSNGEFNQIIDHLFDCLKDNRSVILEKISEQKAKDDTAKIQIIKTFLEGRKSIHLPSEMAAQIQEINKEVWIRGEGGEKNSSKVKEEWAQEHAPSWRQARLIEMKFIVEKKREEIIALF